MKKRIAILAAALTLSACGQSTDTATPATDNTTASQAETPTATDTAEEAQSGNAYTLTDDNGTTYTLDLDAYSDDLTDEADKIIAEAMSEEGDVSADELTGLTEWASLTIDNTESSAESGSSYVDIKIVGDEMQYEIITDPGSYFDELVSDYQTNIIDDTEKYNHIVDVYNELSDEPATLKPGVKHTYPIVLATGRPDTIDSVWCWDLEMTPSN